MSHVRSTSWSYRITLPPQDAIRVRFFIDQETRYFNALVSGLAGPMRTMPETFRAMTGRWEDLFGLAATHGVNPITARSKDLPNAFASYAEMIVSEGDAKKSLLFDVVASPGTLSHVVRKAMAVEVLRAARDQSAAITSPLTGEGSSFAFAVQALSPLETSQKRHVQLPVSAVKRTAADREITLELPYLGKPLTLPVPPVDWNMAILRDDQDGSFTLELCRETTSYNVKRTDASGFNRKRRGPGKRPDRGQRA